MFVIVCRENTEGGDKGSTICSRNKTTAHTISSAYTFSASSQSGMGCQLHAKVLASKDCSRVIVDMGSSMLNPGISV